MAISMLPNGKPTRSGNIPPRDPVPGWTLNAQFNGPEGVAVDNLHGWIYVTDQENNRIQKFEITRGGISLNGYLPVRTAMDSLMALKV